MHFAVIATRPHPESPRQYGVYLSQNYTKARQVAQAESAAGPTRLVCPRNPEGCLEIARLFADYANRIEDEFPTDFEVLSTGARGFCDTLIEESIRLES